MLWIDHGQEWVEGQQRREFKLSAHWHVGKPFPVIVGSVVRFLADGDELKFLIGMLRQDQTKIEIRVARSARGWQASMRTGLYGSVTVNRPTMESALGSLLLDHATRMGISVEEAAVTCVKCGRVFTAPSEYRFRGVDGQAICRRLCREVSVGK